MVFFIQVNISKHLKSVVKNRCLQFSLIHRFNKKRPFPSEKLNLILSLFDNFNALPLFDLLALDTETQDRITGHRNPPVRRLLRALKPLERTKSIS